MLSIVKSHSPPLGCSLLSTLAFLIVALIAASRIKSILLVRQSEMADEKIAAIVRYIRFRIIMGQKEFDRTFG